MEYITLTISNLGNCDELLAEQISVMAWQAGCGGIEEPLEQPTGAMAAGAGVPCAWRIFFAERAAAESCREALAVLFREAGGGDVVITLEARESENWMANWREHFQPLRVGERFIVAPPWWDGKSGGEGLSQSGDWRSQSDGQPRTIIRIEPGMAFGTGTHATTQLCLELAEPLLKPGLNVLDVGTGSGILLIAAALLGASPAVAIDNDPETMENFRLNVGLNGLGMKESHQPSAVSGQPTAKTQSQIRNPKSEMPLLAAEDSASHIQKSQIPNPKSEINFILSDGLKEIDHLRFDLMFANLLAPHIEALLGQMREPRFAAEAAQPLIIGSGLLADEWPALRRGWEERHGLIVEREAFRGEWMAFSGRLRP